MSDFNLSPTEYTEYLQYKREKLLKQVEEIDAKLAKIFSASPSKHTELLPNFKYQNNGNNSVNSLRGSIGWKFIIDDFIKKATKYLSAMEIVDLVVSRPDNTISREVAIKSVGSALATNSTDKKKRYLWKKDKGLKIYTLNKDYKEI